MLQGGGLGVCWSKSNGLGGWWWKNLFNSLHSRNLLRLIVLNLSTFFFDIEALYICFVCISLYGEDFYMWKSVTCSFRFESLYLVIFTQLDLGLIWCTHSHITADSSLLDFRPWRQVINLLKTTRRLLYLKTQFVPRSKHFSSRL